MDETLGKEILQAFQKRLGGRRLICGVCGGTRWVGDGLIKIPLQENASADVFTGGKGLPLIAMTCDVCGFTNFHNVIRLVGKEKWDEIVAGQNTSEDVDKFVQGR